MKNRQGAFSFMSVNSVSSNTGNIESVILTQFSPTPLKVNAGHVTFSWTSASWQIPSDDWLVPLPETVVRQWCENRL